jgi:hypothetical protein
MDMAIAKEFNRKEHSAPKPQPSIQHVVEG